MTKEFERYRDFIEAPEPEPSYRVIDITRPKAFQDGAAVDLDRFLGDRLPPPLALGRAIQNVVSVLEVNDVIVDPLSFQLFSVEAVAASVRTGRQKPASEFMKHALDSDDEMYIGATRSWQNYYHWLVESMPRTMRLSRDFGDVEIVTHGHTAGFHKELLDLKTVNINLREVRQARFARRAHMPTLTTNFWPDAKLSRHSVPAEDVLMFPRAAISSEGKSRRLFLSRRDAKTRVLHDEERLIRDLERRGFDCLVMSDLTLSEQIRLCAEAEVIVSTHGAGLSNMIYRNGPCKVVEIIPLQKWPDRNLICMYNLSQLCGFDHYLYDCAYESDDTRLLSQNWAVDIDKFLSFVDQL